MLLDGANALFEPFNSFVYLNVRELDKGACFSELFVQIGPFLGMTLAHVHLEPFGDYLKFMPEPFGEDAAVASGFDNIGLQPVGEVISMVSRFGNVGSQPVGEVISMVSRFGNVSSQPVGEVVSMVSRFDNIGSQPVGEVVSMPPRISDVGPQLLPQSIRKNLAVSSGFGNVGSKRLADRMQFLTEPFSKTCRMASGIHDVGPQRLSNQVKLLPEETCVASGFGNVGSQRLSRRTDDVLNLCERFLVHMRSASRRRKSRLPHVQSQRSRHLKGALRAAKCNHFMFHFHQDFARSLRLALLSDSLVCPRRSLDSRQLRC